MNKLLVKLVICVWIALKAVLWLIKFSRVFEAIEICSSIIISELNKNNENKLKTIYENLVKKKLTSEDVLALSCTI